MVRVIVLSDTHGNQKLLRKVIEQEQDLHYIIHLGDYYQDMDNNEDLIEGKELVRVPGILNPGYFNGKLPASIVLEIEGWKIGCVHSPQDIPQINQPVDIILYGHTHTPVICKRFGKLEINPGHLKSETDRCHTASYVLLQISEDEVKIEIKEYNCNLKDSYSLIKRK